MLMLPIFKAQKILKPIQTNTNLKEIKILFQQQLLMTYN